MIITFRSRHSGDVIMLGDQAKRVLAAAGRSYEQIPSQGVFTVEQLSDAIQHLETAIEIDPQSAPNQAYAVIDEASDKGEPKPDPITEPVSLRRRAWPLLEMLRTAQKKGCEVVWEVGSAW